jgi:hypothetical protein
MAEIDVSDPLGWARARLRRAEEASRRPGLAAEHRAVAQAMRELLAAFTTRVPRRGWAYRITSQDPDGGECDEGWTWDEKDPWTHDAAAALGLEVAERDVAAEDSYVVHVALVEHGWPDDFSPFVVDELLEYAEQLATDETDLIVGEAERSAWTDMGEREMAELEVALAVTWQSWCRKHRAKIGISRITGTPEIVGSRETQPA